MSIELLKKTKLNSNIIEGNNIKRYNPFNITEDFYIELNENNTPKLLIYFNKKLDKIMKLPIHSGCSLPRSGLLVCNSLSDLVVNKKVLDIGTGYTGLIAHYSSLYGASKVIGTDIDDNVLKVCKTNETKNVKFIKSNVFDKINEKFDVIISNSPQLPMSYGPIHDVGGKDGRDIINKIIENSNDYLNDDGYLILLVFSYLGVDERTNEKESLFEILKKNKFDPKILNSYKVLIRENGMTIKALECIKKQYYKYKFKKEGSFLFNEVKIIMARKCRK